MPRKPKFFTDKDKKVRPLTPRRISFGTHQKGSSHLTIPQSMFFSPRSKYSKIIKMDTPANAQDSVEKLHHLYTSPYTKSSERTKIVQAIVLAANRAYAQLKRKTLSVKEHNEFSAIHTIYRNAYDEIKIGGKLQKENLSEAKTVGKFSVMDRVKVKSTGKSGLVRSFSPSGEYAYVQIGNDIRIYDKSDLKNLGPAYDW